MNDEVNAREPEAQDELLRTVQFVRRRLGNLVVAVWVMSLFLVLTLAAVFGNLINYFDGQVMLWGGTVAGAAILGFVFGWFAARRS